LVHSLADAYRNGLAKYAKEKDEWVAVSGHHRVLVVAEDPRPAPTPEVAPRPIIERHHYAYEVMIECGCLQTSISPILPVSSGNTRQTALLHQ
jgi:hypothetical protein